YCQGAGNEPPARCLPGQAYCGQILKITPVLGICTSGPLVLEPYTLMRLSFECIGKAEGHAHHFPAAKAATAPLVAAPAR
ncbi:MAG: hypothetical protein QOG73_2329, partial [Acetobacteraceae bacterium]|nr:hypothetical protein [Acetobacteraceae bacterium]